MMMEGFDVMFSWIFYLQESEKDGDQTMKVSIAPFTRLVWFMTPNIEFKILSTFYIIVFGHGMLALIMVVICNEQ